MNEEDYYKIECKIKKEDFYPKLKNTTYDLTIQNQAYRNEILSKIQGNRLSLCFSGGGFNGGGMEMFYAQIIENENVLLLEGKFEVLPYIRNGARIFLGIIIVMVLLSLRDGIFMAITNAIVFLLPTFLLYKSLHVFFSSDRGRREIIEYLEKELDGNIIKIISN